MTIREELTVVQKRFNNAGSGSAGSCYVSLQQLQYILQVFDEEEPEKYWVWG
jgi:hypothetical protein